MTRGMNLAKFSPVLFLAGAFTLATALEPFWSGLERQKAKGAVELALGDGRRLFANHFISKADVYFHNGYYPSIFDQAAKKTDSHLTQATEAAHGEAGHIHREGDEHAEEPEGHADGKEHAGHEEEDFLGAPHDFIEAFGRNFFVSKHAHMASADSKELLTWFKIAAEMDPTRVETYTVTAFWLRTALHKSDEAEEFLRQGWKANPDSYAILLELGRLYQMDRKDFERARNLWEIGLKKWDLSEGPKSAEERDMFARQELVARLADVEERLGNLPKAISYLEEVAKLSPFPEPIRKQIEERRARLK